MIREVHVAWPLPIAELKPALELARSLAGADMSVLLLLDEIAGVIVPVVAEGISDAQAELLGVHRPGGEDAFGIALSERRRIVMRDVWHEGNGLSKLAHTIGFRTLEIIPLIGVKDQIVGEIVMMFRRHRRSRRRMLKLIECAARLIVLAVQHARRAVEAERAREAAEQIGRAKIQFLARMSHELRTPLQSIAGYIDLLRLGEAEPLTINQARMLARVHDSEEMLVHVVEDLITFSRIEAGQVAYHIGPVPADEAVRITQSVIAPLAGGRGIPVEVDACSGVFVSADGDKLKQILVNLAANAVKYTRNGTIRISCRGEGDVVRFDVADHGPGIAANKLREIFEPYVQLESARIDRFGGTGLGLAISREFAMAMHGDLSVTSTIGKGSVFTLRLPRATVDGTPKSRTATRMERARR